MKIILANSFKDKLFGLCFKKNVDYILLFKKCSGIHTFFMKFNIDVIMTDNNHNILHVFKSVSKNKIIYNRNAFFVYEIPSTFSYEVKDIINRGIQIHNQEFEPNRLP